MSEYDKSGGESSKAESSGASSAGSGASSSAARQSVGAVSGYSAQQLMLKPSASPTVQKKGIRPGDRADPAVLARLAELDLAEIDTLFAGAAGGGEPAAMPEPLDQVQAKSTTTLQKKSNGSPQVQAKGAATKSDTTTTADPETAKRRIANEITRTEGTGTAADKAVVVAELIKSPLGGLQAVQRAGIKVTVCRNSVTEVLTELAGVRPRGWPPDKTWDSVPGLYDPSGKQVIIATRGGVVPPSGDGHGALNLVLHEFAHAIDAAGGGSDSAEFTAARDADASTLSDYESQGGSAGREETYAESFARYYGGDSNDLREHPNLHAYWAANPLGG